MTDTIEDIEDDVKADFVALYNKIQGNTIVETVETDVKTAATATVSYIKANGLQDAYQIALGVVASAVSGTPWPTVIATIETQVAADGKTLIAGSGAVLAAQAQADLISLGTLIPPASTPPATPAA